MKKKAHSDWKYKAEVAFSYTARLQGQFRIEKFDVKQKHSDHAKRQKCPALAIMPAMPEIIRQFFSAIGAGAMSAIGHYGLFGILTYAGVATVPATTAGALLGALINYAVNYRFTFRSNKRHIESVSKFAVVATVGLVLNGFFMWIGVDLLQINKWVAQIVTTGLCLIWSFGANRYWTFHERPQK